MSAEDEYTLLQIGVVGLVVIAAAFATSLQLGQWWAAACCLYAYANVLWTMSPVMTRSRPCFP